MTVFRRELVRASRAEKKQGRARYSRSVALLLVSLLGAFTPVHGQAIEDELSFIRQRQDALEAEILEIKRILSAREAKEHATVDFGEITIDLGGNPIQGESSAPLVLVEFSDYQCSFCARHFLTTHPELTDTYVRSGQLRFVALDFPLESIHPFAFDAAMATHCAQEQGRFWQMRERLFAHQETLADLASYARELGLDVARFESCMQTSRYENAVREDVRTARKVGARSTPSFVLGRIVEKDISRVRPVAFIRGAAPLEVFEKEIEAALDRLSGSR